MAPRHPVRHRFHPARAAALALTVATAAAAVTAGCGQTSPSASGGADQRPAASSPALTGPATDASPATADPSAPDSGPPTQDPWAPADDAESPALAAPGGLRAEAIDATTARLSWRPSSGPGEVAGYRVHQQGTSTPIAEVGPEVHSTEVGSLEPGISYSFAVQAVGRDGRASGASQHAELTMPERPTEPEPSTDGT